MDKLKRFAEEYFIPIVRDETAKILMEECKKNSPQNILEIGTAIGYSGILMLKSCNGHLYTIEKDISRYEIAKENFVKYGMSERVTLMLCDAKEQLEILKSHNYKFDFVFLDGPKGQYIKYLPTIKSLLNKNAILFSDNVLMHGLINHQEKVTHKNRAMVRNMKVFNDEIMNDKDFDSKFYEIDDGFIVSRKL